MTALDFFAQRAAYYRRTGVAFCGDCGESPDEQPVFAPSMSCGHSWTRLMWRPKTAAEQACKSSEVK